LLPREVYERGDNLGRELLIHIEAHVRELDADIRVESAFADAVEKFAIEVRAVTGFVGIGDVLPEVIEADAHAQRIYFLTGAQRFFHGCAGDKASREPLSHGRTFRKFAQKTALRQRDERCPYHRSPAGLVIEDGGKQLVLSQRARTVIATGC